MFLDSSCRSSQSLPPNEKHVFYQDYTPAEIQEYVEEYSLEGVISESALWTTFKRLVSRSFGAKPPCQDVH